MKAAFMREEQFEKALLCSELSLLSTPEDPYQVRDRGYILHKLDCFAAAKEDYQYFIEQCPDDPAIELIQIQMKALGEEPIVIH
jgi:regulator of sirC expression with transglutaminase-like and TPR domain